MIKGIILVSIVGEAFVLMGFADFSIISQKLYPMTNNTALTTVEGGMIAGGTEGGMLAGTEGGTIGMRGG